MRIMAHPHPMKRTNFFSFPSARRPGGEKITHKERASMKKDAKLNKVMMFL
jgi:hypothetical protein